MTGLVDLHMHSCCSDGVFSPQQLVEKAAQQRVTALALCDHDNIDGIAEAHSAGLSLGVQVVSGVELSCVWGDYQDIHLLGYGFDREYPPLCESLREFQQFRQQRNALIVDKINGLLEKRGLQSLCYERVAERAGGTVGRPHIAMELLELGHVKTMEEAFAKYLVPCNIAKRFFPVDEAIALIQEAGGVAVLAHPPYITRDQQAMATLLDELVAVGLQGIEVYNNGASCDEIEWYLTQSRIRGLITTGGSDFHGIEDGGAELGKVRAIGAIPENCFDVLQQLLDDPPNQKRNKKMRVAQPGNRVKVHYTGTYDDGSEFDSSKGGTPLEFTLGESQVIPGFEQAITGMAVDEEKQVHIEAAQAYGEYDEDQLATVDRSMLPADLELEIGAQLQAQTEEGIPLIVTIAAIEGDQVTLDGNHPMAGKALNFALHLVEICNGDD